MPPAAPRTGFPPHSRQQGTDRRNAASPHEGSMIRSRELRTAQCTMNSAMGAGVKKAPRAFRSSANAAGTLLKAAPDVIRLSFHGPPTCFARVSERVHGCFGIGLLELLKIRLRNLWRYQKVPPSEGFIHDTPANNRDFMYKPFTLSIVRTRFAVCRDSCRLLEPPRSYRDSSVFFGRPGRRMGAGLGSRPASLSACRSTTSIWAFTERRLSAAHLDIASWTAGSSRSSICLRAWLRVRLCSDRPGSCGGTESVISETFCHRITSTAIPC